MDSQDRQFLLVDDDRNQRRITEENNDRMFSLLILLLIIIENMISSYAPLFRVKPLLTIHYNTIFLCYLATILVFGYGQKKTSIYTQQVI